MIRIILVSDIDRLLPCSLSIAARMAKEQQLARQEHSKDMALCLLIVY